MSNILDVAKYAGVSVTTVSRVLNNSAHPVNSETRTRVLDAIEKLNFVPNQLARALANERTRLIGVIVGDGSDPYFANIVRGISAAAQENGYLTIICNTERVPEVELGFLKLLRDYNADGIIFAGGGLTDSNYKDELINIVTKLQEAHVPLIALSNQFLNMPQVKIDDVQASREMTEYLIGLGHTRIGFISGPLSLLTSHLRLDGYKQALEKHGITFDPMLVIEGDFTYECGRQAANDLMALGDPPTAIFGSNDREALGCLFRLKELNILVPEQVSVAGFDDIETAQYVSPPLTTVQVPMQTIGALGVKQFMRALDQTELIEPVYRVQYSLVVRASTAPPPENKKI
ncbi:MAG: LacI family DNA-binding transcriptional regulator [Chloroflexi bacterium]|nr:LacI family DNA-binding transcriptional regulator [Chloroflexota bacterium]